MSSVINLLLFTHLRFCILPAGKHLSSGKTTALLYPVKYKIKNRGYFFVYCKMKEVQRAAVPGFNYYCPVKNKLV